jgi:hypothetical protein
LTRKLSRRDFRKNLRKQGLEVKLLAKDMPIEGQVEEMERKKKKVSMM